jgi:DnaJ-class molecular chaperone
MAEDLYATLGVSKTATADDIRAAFRKAAKKHHPDLNPGNKVAEETFKKISAANEILSDPEQRKKYDSGEIDEAGAQKAPPRGYREYADAAQGARYGYGNPGAEGFGGGADFEDLFGTIFGERGARASGSRKAGPRRGQDAQYTLQAAFLDAVIGATKRLTLPDGQTLDVKIPPGTADGDVLRLRGRGGPGHDGGPAGDALIEISVAPHACFKRDGQDVSLTLPVTLREAVLGEKIFVPTPAGPVAMSIKPGADTGTKMRLKGRGVPAHGSVAAGDLYVTLELHLGPPDPALEAYLREKPAAEPYDPRAGMAAP